MACADRHDIISQSYDDMLKVTNGNVNRLSQLFATFDYADPVLDYSKFTAIALAELTDRQALYEQPTLIGAIQERLMKAGMHNYAVCFGSFHLSSFTDFISVLSQMSLCARKSVSFEIDELSPSYIRGSVAVSET
ncbi:hypothetical protein BDR22DRAFT_889327 [Usnea florida]